MANKQKQTAFPGILLTRKSLMLTGAAIGLALLIIAIAVEVDILVYIGIFILPLSLLCGSLFLKDEPTPMKVTLLVFSGLMLLYIALIAIIMMFSWSVF